MYVPFHKMNLKTSPEELLVIKRILKSGQVVNGAWTRMLEKQFKKGACVKHAIACSSATAGLTIAVKAADWDKKGYDIALPAFTWPSTMYAIDCCKIATPIFTDVDPKTWCMTSVPEEADAAIVVDTFGNRAEVDTDKPIIYDAAHAYGLVGLGNRGIAEVVSLAMTKAVTGMQGGVILTNDDLLAEKAREMVKMFAKITEINAYIALTSMEDYDESLTKRFNVVKKYCELFNISYELQEIPVKTNLSVFAILMENKEKRDRAVTILKELGVETKVYYKPLVTGFPNTDNIYSRILALPTWAGIEKHILEICVAINNV